MGEFGNYHLARMIADSAQRFADRPATRIEGPDGQWQVLTYREFHEAIVRAACALVDLGVQPGDRVAILSANRPEWSIVDLAVASAGAVSVPIFATSTVEQVRHVVTDSGARLVFVAGTRELATVREASAAPRVISFDELDEVSSLASLLATDHSRHRDEIAARTAAGRGDDLATIIYTSGTTGKAKGVMLSHGGFGAQQAAIDECWDFRPTDSSLCFLPLAHALERDWTFHLFHRGCLNTYCPRPKEVGRLLAKARPTLLVSVPMLFEKVMSGARAQASSPVARRTFEWALRVGGQCQHAHRKGATPSLWWRAQLPVADKLVLSKIRSAVGGSKTLLVSGGAPLRREVEEFFSAAGILLGQGYGLTETGPMATIYAPDRFKLGTVGFPIRGAEFRIGAESELLVRTPSMMLGYWGDEEATRAALGEDGWLHTGDVGYVDTDGFVVVTDRLKELIVTANGKNVAPQAVEAALLAEPRFDQVMVVGDSRPCLVAVIQPTQDGWASLAQEAGVTGAPEELADDSAMQALVRQRAADLTSGLAHEEQVRDVILSAGRITQASGLLTPTLKIRRSRVEKAFASQVEATYERLRSSRKSGPAR